MHEVNRPNPETTGSLSSDRPRSRVKVGASRRPSCQEHPFNPGLDSRGGVWEMGPPEAWVNGESAKELSQTEASEQRTKGGTLSSFDSNGLCKWRHNRLESSPKAGNQHGSAET
ncbi:unnamed protein product [Protopolystoma xenopodis]|uniref:Uncharacterized protein n=1 Tax=Protopolystoma xenopodis TaxID=117903 RepID=A0A448WUP0_9PLAT|nr:unnamed protein product [Protopolystoma xenopodis]